MIRSSIGRIFAGLFLLTPFLAGCENKVQIVTPDIERQMTAALLNGTAILDCQFQCVASWSARRQEFAQENAAHDWHDLTTGVMQVGYQSDLGYFYLGRAAQGQGADEAAIRYYEIAASIFQGQNGALKCNGMLNNCDGIAIPYILVTLIEQSKVNIARRQEAETEVVNGDNSRSNAPARPRKHSVKTAASKPVLKDSSDIQLIEPPPVTR